MDKAEKFWDKQATKLDQQYPKYEQVYIKIIETTKKYLNANDIVLDYACGTGTITKEIACSVKEVHAIDISSTMVDLAKRKASEHNIENIKFLRSTIMDVGYPEESFNVILAFNILHFLKDPHLAIERINELLKPGGFFISTTACIGEKMTFSTISIILLSKIGLGPYVKSLKLYDLKDLLIHEKFQIVESERLNYTIPNYFIIAKKV